MLIPDRDLVYNKPVGESIVRRHYNCAAVAKLLIICVDEINDM